MNLAVADLEVSPKCDTRFCNAVATGSIRPVCGHFVNLYCQFHLEQVSLALGRVSVACKTCKKSTDWEIVMNIHEAHK